MPEQVNIASLSIDVDDVIKESVRLKKEIDSLKKSQNELKKSGDTSSAAFVKNEASLRNLNKAYKDNQTFASALEAENQKLKKSYDITINSQEQLAKLTKVEGKSREQLLDDRRKLNVISKQIIGNTEEEINLRAQLNDAIDEQTEALRDQQSEFNAGKDQIGEYTKGINASDLSLQSLIKNSEEAGGATKLISSGLKAATKGMLSFIKASLAFILTPVGAVLAVIAGAFLLIKNAMNRSEDSTNKIKKALSGLSGVVKGVTKILEPLGDFLIDGLVKGFELVEKGITKAMAGIQKALKFLGFKGAAESLASFNDEVNESVKVSKALTKAEIELQKAQRSARLIQLQFQRSAEKLRQIRDDETKSFKERIKANEDLGAVLRKQSKEELEIARKALEVTELRIKLDGESTENLDARAEALIEIADIQERITGQESEQLVNRVSLEKEVAAEIQAIKDAELEQLEENAKEKERIAKEEKEKALELAKEKAEELKEFEDAEKERKLIDSENKFQILEAELDNELALNQAFLDRKRTQELKNAKETGASVALINKKFDLAEKKLKADIVLYKQQQDKVILNDLKQLFGESSKIGKAFAIAEIANTTAQNASKAFGQAAVFAANPLTLPLAANANIQGGLIIALGAAQAAKTAGIKFSKGDILKGKSHNSGGIPFSIGGKLGFEAEGGESIINKRSTSMFAPLLSAINQAGGGKKFGDGSILGSASASAANLIDYELLGAVLAEANMSLPAPKVSIEEIREVDDNVSVVENLATT